MEQQLWEKSPTDGKETQTTLDQPNSQLLSLSLKLKSTQMDQLALFHKKLTNNLMESNNSRNHSTSQIKKSLMTTRTDTMLTKNQIQVLMLKLNLMLKLKRIQTLLWEQLEQTTKKPTRPTFQENHISLKHSTVMQLWERSQIDGKETQTTLVQPNSQPLNHFPKRKKTQLLISTAIMMPPTTPTSPVIKLLKSNSMELQLWEKLITNGK